MSKATPPISFYCDFILSTRCQSWVKSLGFIVCVCTFLAAIPVMFREWSVVDERFWGGAGERQREKLKERREGVGSGGCQETRREVWSAFTSSSLTAGARETREKEMDSERKGERERD